jgi:hypothetical protein
MTNEVMERIAFEVSTRFYYIEYPDGVPLYIWKDGNGEHKYIEKMGLDHLKASINTVQKDKKAFLKSYSKDLNGPAIIEAIIPLIDKKLSELQEVLKRKANE